MRTLSISKPIAVAHTMTPVAVSRVLRAHGITSARITFNRSLVNGREETGAVIEIFDTTWPVFLAAWFGLKEAFDLGCAWVEDGTAYSGCILEHPEYPGSLLPQQDSPQQGPLPQQDPDPSARARVETLADRKIGDQAVVVYRRTNGEEAHRVHVVVLDRNDTYLNRESRARGKSRQPVVVLAVSDGCSLVPGVIYCLAADQEVVA